MRDYDYNEPVLDQPVEMNACGDKEYIRPRMDYLRDYPISIRFLSLGCLVQVGCKEIAFTSIEEAMKEVNAYVANPKASTDKFNKLFKGEK